ncbi:DUF6500 family protein [Yersinia proxima]|uniref:DUF6500 family protein n=1 Tax=Yersinia proxima TaxID=2890316 RepID=UPI001D1042CD|nr:DUF6500 family protein [Yersinia proxima]
MRAEMKEKIIRTCEAKIAAKGGNVGLSFYAFFANKNDDPELLMEVAHWWIMEMKLDHFEKAEKIKSLAQSRPYNYPACLLRANSRYC